MIVDHRESRQGLRTVKRRSTTSFSSLACRMSPQGLRVPIVSRHDNSQFDFPPNALPCHAFFFSLSFLLVIISSFLSSFHFRPFHSGRLFGVLFPAIRRLNLRVPFGSVFYARLSACPSTKGQRIDDTQTHTIDLNTPDFHVLGEKSEKVRKS